MARQDVCDVVTSPIDPLIIASCSDDTTVRIWSLDPKHEKQPCLCILGGEGHYWSLLTLVCPKSPSRRAVREPDSDVSTRPGMTQVVISSLLVTIK